MILAAACSGDVCPSSSADTVIIVVVVALLVLGIVRGLLALARKGRPPGLDPEVVKEQDLQAAQSGTTRIKTVKSSEVENLGRRYQDQGWEVVQQSTAKSFGSKARITITFRKQ